MSSHALPEWNRQNLLVDACALTFFFNKIYTY